MTTGRAHRSARWPAWIPCAVWIVTSSAFVVTAITMRGRLAGLAAVLAGLSAGVMSVAPGAWRLSSRAAQLAGVSAAVALMILASLAASAPRGTGGDAHLAVRHVFVDPSFGFSRWAATNLVPEIDQVAFGIAVAAALDPRTLGDVARRRSVTVPLYDGLGADPAFRDMGSIWAQAYRWQGHYVAIVPSGRAAAAIVFLHGSVGNFASYWYALTPLARHDAVALFFPSFRSGAWQQQGSADAVRNVVSDAGRRFGVDALQIVLAGISNGGLGVTRAVTENRYRGVILLSAVLDHQLVSEGIAAGTWRDLPVLFVNGERDDIVPLDPAAREVSRLERAGARVTRLVVPGEDHFVFYARRDLMIDTISRWMTTL